MHSITAQLDSVRVQLPPGLQRDSSSHEERTGPVQPASGPCARADSNCNKKAHRQQNCPSKACIQLPLMLQGEPGRKLYFVRSGLLEVKVARCMASFRRAFVQIHSLAGCQKLAHARVLRDDAALAGRTIPLLQLLASVIGRSMRNSVSALVRPCNWRTVQLP